MGDINEKIVMLVDDDADDRKLFCDAVKEIDPSIHCITAKDGRLALEMLHNPESPIPDLIFLDLRMPLFNGKQCLQQIKSDDRLKEIPVIVYTTSRDVEESAELQDWGAEHFVSKPTEPEDIYYLITCALEQHVTDTRKNN